MQVSAHPDSAWVIQQARNSTFSLEVRAARVRFLIHDRDGKYSGPFDEVFRTEGVTMIRTPIRDPRANAFAERWVRTVRTECLDWTLVRAGDTSSASYAPTSCTTIVGDRIAKSASPPLLGPPPLRAPRSLDTGCLVATSLVGSSASMTLLHDWNPSSGTLAAR